MTETFAALLMAHVLADFVFQTRQMVETKRRPATLLLHGALVLLTAQAALGRVDAWQPAALALAHVVIDLVKAWVSPKGVAGFLGDQAAHLATIVAVAAVAPELWGGGLWGGAPWLASLMAATAGLILATRAGGFAVGLLMEAWSDVDLPRGLANGGWLIGNLERSIIYLLVLIGEPAGIGFLIAAKSVLRFETTSKDQRAGEYVIVGTLASFAWAMAVAWATLSLLSRLADIGIPGVSP